MHAIGVTKITYEQPRVWQQIIRQSRLANLYGLFIALCLIGGMTMSNQYIIQSALPGSKASGYSDYVVDAAEGGTSNPMLGGELTLFPFKSSGNGNQLWTFIPAPDHLGYFFIQSALPDNKGQNLVIDIRGDADDVKPSDSTPINMYTNKHNSGEKYKNQLWRATSGSPTGFTEFGYDEFLTCFLKSYVKDDNNDELVIDVKGVDGYGTPNIGTPLQVHHKKSGNTQNQEWYIRAHEGCVFSPTVSVHVPEALLDPPISPPTITLKCRGFVPGHQIFCTLELNGPPSPGPTVSNAYEASIGIADLAGNIDFTLSNQPVLLVDQPGAFQVSVWCQYQTDLNTDVQTLSVLKNYNWDGLSLS
jgi:hypothetical protein